MPDRFPNTNKDLNQNTAPIVNKAYAHGAAAVTCHELGALCPGYRNGEERNALLAALDDEFRPNHYIIGIHDRALAGQPVPHLDVHMIPRFEGDHEAPRGGHAGSSREKQAVGSNQKSGKSLINGDSPRLC
jgi:hypothetical protein